MEDFFAGHGGHGLEWQIYRRGSRSAASTVAEERTKGRERERERVCAEGDRCDAGGTARDDEDDDERTLSTRQPLPRSNAFVGSCPVHS